MGAEDWSLMIFLVISTAQRSLDWRGRGDGHRHGHVGVPCIHAALDFIYQHQLRFLEGKSLLTPALGVWFSLWIWQILHWALEAEEDLAFRTSFETILLLAFPSNRSPALGSLVNQSPENGLRLPLFCLSSFLAGSLREREGNNVSSALKGPWLVQWLRHSSWGSHLILN